MTRVENCSNIGERIISSKKYQWDDRGKVIDYKFKFPQNPERNRIEGEVELISKTLEDTRKIEGDAFFSTLIKRGIKQNDIIVQINKFYPNDEGADIDIKKNTEQGFGTGILEFLLEEIKTEPAKVLYVGTWRKEMKDFIWKRGFEPIDKEKARMRFFRILD